MLEIHDHNVDLEECDFNHHIESGSLQLTDLSRVPAATAIGGEDVEEPMASRKARMREAFARELVDGILVEMDEELIKKQDTRWYPILCIAVVLFIAGLVFGVTNGRIANH